MPWYPEKSRRVYTGLVKLNFSGEGAKNYERIFGSDEECAERRRKAIAEQRKAEKRAAAATVQNVAPVVLADSRYRTDYDPGLGCGYESNSERKRIMKQKKLREFT